MILNVIEVFTRIDRAWFDISRFPCPSLLWYGGFFIISCLRMTNGKGVSRSSLDVISVVCNRKRKLICFLSVDLLRSFGVGWKICSILYPLFFVSQIFGVFLEKMVLFSVRWFPKFLSFSIWTRFGRLEIWLDLMIL